MRRVKEVLSEEAVERSHLNNIGLFGEAVKITLRRLLGAETNRNVELNQKHEYRFVLAYSPEFKAWEMTLKEYDEDDLALVEASRAAFPSTRTYTKGASIIRGDQVKGMTTWNGIPESVEGTVIDILPTAQKPYHVKTHKGNVYAFDYEELTKR